MLFNYIKYLLEMEIDLIDLEIIFKKLEFVMIKIYCVMDVLLMFDSYYSC